MEKSLATFDNGTTCSAWNHCGQRLATGSADGTLSIFDSQDPASTSSSFTCTSKSRIYEAQAGIVKVVWVPPEYGDAVACICADGTMSLWEEVIEDAQPLQWKLCKSFKSNSSKVLDIQFGISLTSLKMVAAQSDGHVKVFELLDSLEMKNWQLQAEFQNVIESVSTFDTPQLNSSKVWEFDQAHQRWLPVAELALPGDKGDQVHAVAWAPNIGRPYEVIAVATLKGIAIWHLGLDPDLDGRLSVEKVALLSGHEGKVWQMEWDMSGMTLATTGNDGMVASMDRSLYRKLLLDDSNEDEIIEEVVM
nr:protein seh1 [Quercus suber]